MISLFLHSQVTTSCQTSTNYELVSVNMCLCSTCVTLCTSETVAETFKDLVDLWNPLHNAMILPGIVAEPHTGSSVRLLLEVKGQIL